MIIRKSATRAVERAADDEFDQPSCETPVTIAAEWSTTNHATRASGLLGVERVGGRTTSFTADTYDGAFEASVAMIQAGSAGRNKFYG